jgi:hypothetical protein
VCGRSPYPTARGRCVDSGFARVGDALEGGLGDSISVGFGRIVDRANREAILKGGGEHGIHHRLSLSEFPVACTGLSLCCTIRKCLFPSHPCEISHRRKIHDPQVPLCVTRR